MQVFNPYEQIFQRFDQLEQKLESKQNNSEPAIEIITPTELNRRLQISEPTRIRWSKRKVIPEIRLGASVRYNWPAVVASLEKQSK